MNQERIELNEINIFVSYRRQFKPDATARLVDKLRDVYGYDNVFFDRDSIPAGVNFEAYIQRIIPDMRFVIFLVSPFLGNSPDFVKIELEVAFDFDVPIIPVLLGDQPMLDHSAFPEGLRHLSKNNASIIRLDTFHTDFDELAKKIMVTSQIVEEVSTLQYGVEPADVTTTKPGEVTYLDDDVDLKLNMDSKDHEIIKADLEALKTDVRDLKRAMTFLIKTMKSNMQKP